MILAGAGCVQVVGTLYRNRVKVVQEMLATIEAWMEAKGYESLSDFRGGMDVKHNSNPWVYTRAQYVKLLFNPDRLRKNLEAEVR